MDQINLHQNFLPQPIFSPASAKPFLQESQFLTYRLQTPSAQSLLQLYLICNSDPKSQKQFYLLSFILQDYLVQFELVLKAHLKI